MSLITINKKLRLNDTTNHFWSYSSYENDSKFAAC